MVDVDFEHSDFLTSKQAEALELALTHMGFSIPQIGQMVRAASQLPAQSPSDLETKRRRRS